MNYLMLYLLLPFVLIANEGIDVVDILKAKTVSHEVNRSRHRNLLEQTFPQSEMIVQALDSYDLRADTGSLLFLREKLYEKPENVHTLSILQKIKLDEHVADLLILFINETRNQYRSIAIQRLGDVQVSIGFSLESIDEIEKSLREIKQKNLGNINLLDANADVAISRINENRPIVEGGRVGDQFQPGSDEMVGPIDESPKGIIETAEKQQSPVTSKLFRNTDSYQKSFSLKEYLIPVILLGCIFLFIFARYIRSK